MAVAEVRDEDAIGFYRLRGRAGVGWLAGDGGAAGAGPKDSQAPESCRVCTG